MHSELLWGQHSSNEYLEYFNTYTGEFEVSLTEYEPYKFQPRKVNHTAQRILVDPRGMEKQGIDTLDLILYVDRKGTCSRLISLNQKKEIHAISHPRKMRRTFCNRNHHVL